MFVGMDDNGGISQSPVSTEPTEVCFIAIARSIALNKSTSQKLQWKFSYVIDSTPNSTVITPEYSSHTSLRHSVAEAPVDVTPLDSVQRL